MPTTILCLKRNDCFSIIGTFFSYIKCTAPKFPFLWFLSAHKNREPCKNMLFNVQHQLSKLISMQMSSRFKWVFLIQLSLWHSLEILNKGSLVKPHYKRCRPYLGIFGGNWHKNTAYLPWRGRSETFCDIRDTILNVYIRVENVRRGKKLILEVKRWEFTICPKLPLPPSPLPLPW